MALKQIEQNDRTKGFIESVNSAIAKGLFKNQGDIVDALYWNASVMSEVMGGKRNVPTHIVNRFHNLHIFNPTRTGGIEGKYSTDQFLGAIHSELIESFGGLSIDKNGKETHVPYMVLGIVQQAIKRLQPKIEMDRDKPVLSDMEIAGILAKRKKTIENGKARIK